MKICVNALLIDHGKTGGGEVFLVNLMKRIARLDRRNSYLVLVTKANGYLFERFGENVTTDAIFASPRSRFLRLLFENFILPFYLLRHKVDLYYSPFGSLPLFLPCRSVVTIQNLIYLDFGHNVPYRGASLASRMAVNLQALYYKLITPLTLKRADRIWAVSQATADSLQRSYGLDDRKLEVIYEGVEYEEFRPSRRDRGLPAPFPFPYIITIASMYPNKNIDKIIRAFAPVVARGFPHRLVVVGHDWLGYRSRLEELTRTCGVENRVIFAGAVEHLRIPSYLWGADLFLLLSGVESFGLPLLEAMAAGVPVIVSDSSSLPEIAGGAALTSPPADGGQLTEQIVRILTDKTLSDRLRRMGTARARKFDWNSTAAKAVALFEVASGTGKRPFTKDRDERRDKREHEPINA